MSSAYPIENNSSHTRTSIRFHRKTKKVYCILSWKRGNCTRGKKLTPAVFTRSLVRCVSADLSRIWLPPLGLAPSSRFFFELNAIITLPPRRLCYRVGGQFSFNSRRHLFDFSLVPSLSLSLSLHWNYYLLYLSGGNSFLTAQNEAAGRFRRVKKNKVVDNCRA